MPVDETGQGGRPEQAEQRGGGARGCELNLQERMPIATRRSPGRCRWWSRRALGRSYSQLARTMGCCLNTWSWTNERRNHTTG
jgi:hypothetical protein